MLKETDEAEAPSVHPLDEKYASLHAALRLMPETDPQFKLLQTYCANTAGYHGGMKLQHVWEVEGEKDGAAFAQHAAGLSNHKLLWHGTNVAVVAAILNGGLRIMPHSGACCKRYRVVLHVWMSVLGLDRMACGGGACLHPARAPWVDALPPLRTNPAHEPCARTARLV